MLLHPCFSFNQETSFQKDLTVIPTCRVLVSIAELGRHQTEHRLEKIRRCLGFTQSNQGVNGHADHTTGLDLALSKKPSDVYSMNTRSLKTTVFSADLLLLV